MDKTQEPPDNIEADDTVCWYDIDKYLNEQKEKRQFCETHCLPKRQLHHVDCKVVYISYLRYFDK